MFSGVLAPPNSRSSRLEYSMAGCENPSIFGFPLLQIVSSPISSFAFASMPLSDLHLFLYQLDLLFGCHYGFLLFCLYLLRHELQNPLSSSIMTPKFILYQHLLQRVASLFIQEQVLPYNVFFQLLSLDLQYQHRSVLQYKSFCGST